MTAGRSLVRILAVVLGGWIVDGVASESASPPSPTSLVEAMKKAARELTDYRCVFTKRQRIDGELREMETILLAQSRPLGCVYMKWIEDPYRNRETIWCRERYGGELQAHEGSGVASWLGTMSLDPHGTLAMRDNLHPVTEAGIYHTISLVAENLARLGESAGPVEPREIHGQPSWCLRAEASPTSGETDLCVHRELSLPTRVTVREPGGQIVEDYTYRDYDLNPGLTERTFDVENPDYAF